MRESWLTESDECAKPTWKTHAMLLPRNWLPLF